MGCLAKIYSVFPESGFRGQADTTATVKDLTAIIEIAVFIKIFYFF